MDRMVWRGWHAYLINDWIDTVIMAQTIAFQFDEEKQPLIFPTGYANPIGQTIADHRNIELGIRVQEPQVSDSRLSTTINMLPHYTLCMYVYMLAPWFTTLCCKRWIHHK